MAVNGENDSNGYETRAWRLPWLRYLTTTVVAGLLIGLGTLALVRGLWVYVEFYSFASGIDTGRLTEALFWSGSGGIVLASGIVVLYVSLAYE